MEEYSFDIGNVQIGYAFFIIPLVTYCIISFFYFRWRVCQKKDKLRLINLILSILLLILYSIFVIYPKGQVREEVRSFKIKDIEKYINFDRNRIMGSNIEFNNILLSVNGKEVDIKEVNNKKLEEIKKANFIKIKTWKNSERVEYSFIYRGKEILNEN